MCRIFATVTRRLSLEKIKPEYVFILFRHCRTFFIVPISKYHAVAFLYDVAVDKTLYANGISLAGPTYVNGVYKFGGMTIRIPEIENYTIYVVIKHSTPTVDVTGVSVYTETAQLTVGSTVTLTATIAPDNATNTNITWSSNDETVATVSQEGVVTALDSGIATITVTTEDGEFTATCNITIPNVPEQPEQPEEPGMLSTFKCPLCDKDFGSITFNSLFLVLHSVFHIFYALLNAFGIVG